MFPWVRFYQGLPRTASLAPGRRQCQTQHRPAGPVHAVAAPSHSATAPSRALINNCSQTIAHMSSSGSVIVSPSHAPSPCCCSCERVGRSGRASAGSRGCRRAKAGRRVAQAAALSAPRAPSSCSRNRGPAKQRGAAHPPAPAGYSLCPPRSARPVLRLSRLNPAHNVMRPPQGLLEDIIRLVHECRLQRRREAERSSGSMCLGESAPREDRSSPP